jgi:hypothetical protein
MPAAQSRSLQLTAWPVLILKQYASNESLNSLMPKWLPVF